MLNILVSFAEGERAVESCLRPDWRTLLDSGAFANFSSGKDVVTLGRYMDFLREHGPRFWRYFALDKIADAAVSRSNLHSMLDAGLRPIPVFQRGGTLAEMQELRQVSDVVGIGGIAGRLGSHAHKKYLHDVIRAAGDHKVHLLGCATESLLRKYRPFSCDSSSHAVRHGLIRLWFNRRLYVLSRTADGVTRINGKPALENRTLYALLLAEYGLDMKTASTREFFSSFQAKVTSLRSYMRFQKVMRRIGVMYFVACVASDISPCVAAWELERERWDEPVPDVSSGTRLTA